MNICCFTLFLNRHGTTVALLLMASPTAAMPAATSRLHQAVRPRMVWRRTTCRGHGDLMVKTW
jgi:hypothetical protein